MIIATNSQRGEGARKRTTSERIWRQHEEIMIGQIPRRVAIVPEGIRINKVTVEKRLRRNPTSTRLAPACNPYSGKMGEMICQPMKKANDVPATRLICRCALNLPNPAF